MKKVSPFWVALLLVYMVSCNKTTSNDQPSSNEDIVEINQSFIDSIHQYDELFPFSEGLAAVKKGDKFGYINISGALVIPCQYLYVGPFKEGLACVVKDEDDKNISFIDTEGKFLKTKYPFNEVYYLGNSRFSYIDSGLSFQNGVCEINYSPNPKDRNQLTDLITVYLDKRLKETDKPCEENNVTDKNNDVEVFYEPDKDIYGDETELKGLKDKNGEIIIPAKYNNLQFSDNGVVLATMFVEDAESHQAHPFNPIPYGLKIYGYIDFNGNSTFTETDYGKIEGFKTAQLPIYNNAKLKGQKEQARLEAEQAEQEMRSHPETKFNQLLDDIAWQCLGYSLDGESEYIVSFKPQSDTSGYASFVKWAGHNERRSYARSPSYDSYHYVIKGDIIELKSNVTEIDMSFKITYKDGEIVLRSLDYVNNGIFKPTQKRIGLFPQNFDMK